MPLFSERIGSFVVAFKRKSEEKPDYLEQLTKTQKAIILYLEKVEEASTSELAAKLNVNHSTVHRNVNKMKDLIEWTGETLRDPTGKYKIIRKK